MYVFCKKRKPGPGSILSRSKTYPWESRFTLFESLIESVLLYSSEVWGLQYTEQLKIVQTKFLKYLLGCAINTSNIYLRLQWQRTKIAVNIWKRALTLWQKILNTSDDRYPKIIYSNKTERNWLTQIKTRRIFCRQNLLHRRQIFKVLL